MAIIVGRLCAVLKHRVRRSPLVRSAWPLAVCLSLFSAIARGDVTSVVSNTAHFSATLIPAPASTVAEALLGGTHVFEEKHDVTLGAGLNVDVGLSGIPGVYQTGDAYAPGVIPAGTHVNSFFVHFDTPGVNHQSMQVFIQTDVDILGVILSDDLLDASDLDPRCARARPIRRAWHCAARRPILPKATTK